MFFFGDVSVFNVCEILVNYVLLGLINIKPM